MFCRGGGGGGGGGDGGKNDHFGLRIRSQITGGYKHLSCLFSIVCMAATQEVLRYIHILLDFDSQQTYFPLFRPCMICFQRYWDLNAAPGVNCAHFSVTLCKYSS